MSQVIRAFLLVVIAAWRIATPVPAQAQSDPLGTFNSWSYAFNRVLLDSVINPVVEVVRTLPPPVRDAASNFYSNLVEPVSALSWAMAGNAENAARSVARFSVNSTVGLGGIFDPARDVGLPLRKKYFSEGVCALDIPTGPYLVVPGVGPSTVGIFAAGAFLLFGTTYLVSYVSLELVIASLAMDFIDAAATLEALSASTGASAESLQAAFEQYLRDSGCTRAAPAMVDGLRMR
jgi:phospholipid-binding lipoprotein MlaA